MADKIPDIEDNPKAALESFIRELETYYYSWYDSASGRNFYALFVAQALSFLCGFATALVAAILRQDQLGSWSTGRVLLVVLPLIGALASTFVVQSRIADMLALRESGRETIQLLANSARAEYAAATTPERYTQIHRDLVAKVSALEQEQSRGFQRLVPSPLTFKSDRSGD